MKKYELTEQTINLPGTTLYRIRALVDFGNVEAGDFGGYIASEKNLSHTGKCWVGGEAWAYGNSEVCENAVVCENAKVCGETKICGESVVCGNAGFYEGEIENFRKVIEEKYSVEKKDAWFSVLDFAQTFFKKNTGPYIAPEHVRL